jgi:hypothetical protein
LDFPASDFPQNLVCGARYGIGTQCAVVVSASSLASGMTEETDDAEGHRQVNDGQELEYELVTNRGRTSAENLKVA